MQYPSCRVRCAILMIALGSMSCLPAPEPADVTYGGEAPVAVGEAGTNASPNAGSGGSGTRSVGGSGGSTSAASSGGSVAGYAAGSGGAGSSQVPGATSVSFDVTTLSQGGKYSPKNIGAIWVQSASGTFVKSLELWAKQRRSHLTKFNSVVGTAGAVDVTASATLTSHRAHHVSWNLKDRSGASVAPGKYTVYVEVTDYDGTGKSYSVNFDTTQGKQSTTPVSSPYYNAMSLQLE